MGANVLGAKSKSDCPNNGYGLPAESAAICWNSVCGQGEEFACCNSEGFAERGCGV